MNPVASLNLSTHDQGVAAIATLPVALDWLAIAFPPIVNNSFAFPALPHPPPSTPSRPPRPPVQDPITRRQAAAALVRHLKPYSSREVFAPCFCVESRFVLGRTLGNLYVPPELGIPHLANERCADARFVLDLQYGSIVEVRQYPATKALLCIAYASLRAEFLSLSLPTLYGPRVEITYRRDQSASPPQPEFGHLFEHMPRAQASWHQFCTNYAHVFPTGALTATVTVEPGPAVASFKSESITVTYNDPYAMTFSQAQSSLRPGSQARRIAPKRLLPRPPS